jgi:ketosteroid isomerase-like protein
MTDQHESDRAALHAVRRLFEQAVEQNTLEDLGPHLDPEFSTVSFTDTAFNDFASFNKQWKASRQTMVGSGSFTTTLTPEPTVFVGDVAVCKGDSDNTMVDSKGRLFKFTSHWTVVFKRADNQWKILRSHSSLDPFRNPVVVHYAKRTALVSSLLAFVVGGVACSLATYWLLH